jgi:ankyrin repeat protein
VRTALRLELRSGHVEVPLILIRHGADRAARESARRWTYGTAPGVGKRTQGCCTHIVLVERGVDVTVHDMNGQIVLHLAPAEGHVDITLMLGAAQTQ